MATSTTLPHIHPVYLQSIITTYSGHMIGISLMRRCHVYALMAWPGFSIVAFLYTATFMTQQDWHTTLSVRPGAAAASGLQVADLMTSPTYKEPPEIT